MLFLDARLMVKRLTRLDTVNAHARAQHKSSSKLAKMAYSRTLSRGAAAVGAAGGRVYICAIAFQMRIDAGAGALGR